MRALANDPTLAGRAEDPWDASLDSLHAQQVLSRLGPHHRAALTLRYLDDLPVPQVAALLNRTLHATEALSQSTASTSVTSQQEYRHGDVGYAWLSVPDVEQASAFFATVLGWTYAPGTDALGRQVVGRSPHLGLHGGAERSTLNCCLAVADVAAAVTRVRAAGGQAGEPLDAPYGVVADCTDDQGTVFALYQPPGGVGTEPPGVGGEGDLVYVTFEVVDSGRARAFYGDVLGWGFTPGGVPDGWQVEGGMAGLHGGHARATTLPMWQVDDLAAAVGRVRRAGGTSTEPQTRPYGLEAECTDDQGTRFYLGQL